MISPKFKLTANSKEGMWLCRRMQISSTMAVFYNLRWMGWRAHWYCCIIIYIQYLPIICFPAFLIEAPFCLVICLSTLFPILNILWAPQVGWATLNRWLIRSYQQLVQKRAWVQFWLINLEGFAEVFWEAPSLRRELQEASFSVSVSHFLILFLDLKEEACYPCLPMAAFLQEWREQP